MADLRETVVPLALRRPVVGGLLTLTERFAAAVGLLVLAPLLLLVAVAVLVSSRGPVVYRQVRVGQYGRRFTIYKFRTMRAGADAELRALLAERGQTVPTAFLKIQADPRVTPVGRLLRRTSLDELPQLVDVVKGDMSLIGPRPQTPLEASTYDERAWRRLLVRPGLTGLWQVSGRSGLSAEEGLALDAHYVQSWNVRLDLQVLVRTAGAVVSQRGAH